MTQAPSSEISCFASRSPVWDISDAMAAHELRGPALYDALMALKPAGLSEYAWAEQAGLNRGFLNDIKKTPDASPRASSLTKLLERAGKTLGDLYGAANQGGRSEVEEAPLPFLTHDLPRNVPILGTAQGADLEVPQGGKSVKVEKTLVEAEPIAHARRPPSIANNRHVYALYIQGESMMHRFRPGDLVYVDPRREPHIGEDVIVQLIEDARGDADPAEVTSVLVKTLERKTATHYELSQYNPPITFRLERRKVAAIHRIIPLSELLS